MKKIIAITALFCAFVATEVKAQVQWPAAKATSLTISASGTTALTISNNMNYVATAPTLTAAATISLTPGTNLRPGAMVMISVKTTSTEVTTFAGSAISASVTGVAGKTWSQGFYYNGTYFYPMGAKIQID